MRKMFNAFFGALTLLAPAGGCSLFRNGLISRQDSLHTAALKQSLRWKADSLHEAVRLFSYSDSSGVQFDVEIIPSGAFVFSAQEGFAGSASRVRLRGKTETSRKVEDFSGGKVQVASSGSLKKDVNIKTSTTQQQRKAGGNSLQWWVLILLSACLLVFAVVRRVKLKTSQALT